MPAHLDHHRIRTALRVTRALGVGGALLGLVALLGYAAAIESFYRPLPAGPATHPITALMAIMLGAALGLRNRVHPSPIETGLAGGVLLLASVRLWELIGNTQLLNAITPFQDVILSQQALGKSVSIGINTALMMFLLAVSLLLRRTPTWSQLFASAGFALALISVTGYAYAIGNFHGQMSLLTVGCGVALSASALLMSAHRGMLRAILSPFIGGRIARLQILLGYFGPFLIGFLMLKLMANTAHEFFGLFVVITSWFVTWLVIISAVMQDKVDRKRRAAERRLEFAAGHDPLTGLMNRRNFLDHAHKERARAVRTGRPFALLMLDVDHFKRVNDRAGHVAGDQLLLRIACALRDELRGGDIAARIGGEEFVILLPETPLAQTALVAERIRSAIENLRLPQLPADVASISISIGYTIQGADETLDAVMSRADTALYRAKEHGRNRVESLTEESVTVAA